MDAASDPHNIIRHFISQIKSDYEKELVDKLIYKKNGYHKIKYIPFDENWIIEEDFVPCKSALICLSQIKNALRYFDAHFKSYECKKIVMYVSKLFEDIMKCMLIYGCKNVPCHISKYYYTNGSSDCITRDMALGMSHSVINNMLRS